MKVQPLYDAMLMHVHRDKPDNLEPIDIAKEFIEMNEKRILEQFNEVNLYIIQLSIQFSHLA